MGRETSIAKQGQDLGTKAVLPTTLPAHEVFGDKLLAAASASRFRDALKPGFARIAERVAFPFGQGHGIPAAQAEAGGDPFHKLVNAHDIYDARVGPERFRTEARGVQRAA